MVCPWRIVKEKIEYSNSKTSEIINTNFGECYGSACPFYKIVDNVFDYKTSALKSVAQCGRTLNEGGKE